MNTAPADRLERAVITDPIVLTGLLLRDLSARGVDVPDDDATLRDMAARAGSTRGSDVVFLRGLVAQGRRAVPTQRAA